METQQKTTMENNATVILLRLLLQKTVERMGKDADPEALEKFINITNHMETLPDFYQTEAQQFCLFGEYKLLFDAFFSARSIARYFCLQPYFLTTSFLSNCSSFLFTLFSVCFFYRFFICLSVFFLFRDD